VIDTTINIFFVDLTAVELFDERLAGYVVANICQSLILHPVVVPVFDTQDFALLQMALPLEYRQQPDILQTGGNKFIQSFRAYVFAQIRDQDYH